MNALLVAVVALGFSLCLWTTPVHAHHVPEHVLIADTATVAVVASAPPGAQVGHGPMISFYENKFTIQFNQPVVTHEIEMTDAEGCKVSQSSAVAGDKIIVQMKACKVYGFAPGHMHVNWTVNGVKGEYHLHVRKHH